MILPFIVELRDRDFNFIKRIETEIKALEWGYSRIGGCDQMNIMLHRDAEDFGDLSADYDIQLKVKNPTTEDYDLWWRGFLEGRQPNFSEPQEISVPAFGYVSQLQRKYVDKTYTSQEVSVIVKDVLSTFVTPNTKIVQDNAKIDVTTVTPDSLEFDNIRADVVMKTLAELVGAREWGVDRERDFFFQARSTTVAQRYIAGRDIERFRVLDSFRSMVNQVIIEGGDVAGSKFTRTVKDQASIDKFGLREEVVSNDAIVSNAVADSYGGAILTEKANLQRRASGNLNGVTSLFENSTPLGTVVVKGILGGTRWGTKNWGTFLWGGEFGYQVNSLRYKFNSVGELTVRVDLGQVRPELIEIVRNLGLKLEQVRAR